MPLRSRQRDRSSNLSGHVADRAIVDIGSNTVRAVVFSGSPRAPTVFLNEKVTAKLGRRIATEGDLAPEAIEIAMRGLKRYALIFRELEVKDVTTVATAAVREASNGDAFLEQIRALGFAPKVLSGEEEARSSAHGIMGAFPGAEGLVADLGGGSLEIVRVDGSECSDADTLPLGTLRLAALREEHGEGTRKVLSQMLKKAGWDKPVGGPLYLVGGTWRAMAVFAMQRAETLLTDPHGYELTAKQAGKLADTLAAADPADLAAIPRISTMRAEKLPDAALLLQVLLKRIEPDRLIFSSWGLREGLVYERLAPHMKTQDPLLAGVAVFGAMRGAPPTLAALMAGWTVRAVPNEGRGSERVRLAATTLALASMQIEPNLRIQQGVEWALYKRWLAIEPHERAMLAAAICGNGNVTELPEALLKIASAEQLEEALCWGLAIRLCRRLSARSRRAMQASTLSVEDGRLLLRIEEEQADLFGIPNEKDLKALGERLGLDYAMEVVREAHSTEVESVLRPADEE